MGGVGRSWETTLDGTKLAIYLNMANRTTISEVRSTFRALCQAVGVCEHNEASTYAASQARGAWILDYSAPNGGYRIEELIPSGGCNSDVFCRERMTAGELVRAMRCAIKTIHANQKVRETNNER